jgi:putative heme iron utilization protein
MKRRQTMLFVALLKARPGTLQERIARRMAWQVPQEGGETVAEYWLQTPDPAAVVVFKADHIGQIWAGFAGWDDFFDISIYPATTAQEGLELLKQMMPG